MIFKKQSLFGNENEMDLPITLEEWDNFQNAPKKSRPKIQDAFPKLNVDQREFILTGMTPEEWDEYCGVMDEEEEEDYEMSDEELVEMHRLYIQSQKPLSDE